MQQIQEIPLIDRPRERLRRLGPSVLRSDELLAILLGSGSKKDPVLEVSRALIRKFGSIDGLSRASLEELQEISGIGIAKALTLKAAFELSSRSQSNGDENPFIKTAKDAFLVAKPFVKNEKRELFLALLLNVRNQLISIEVISIGILTATLVHPREVFAPAIQKKANSIIVIHNHPSSYLKPSPEDFEVTKQLKDASEVMGIPLVDHLIISEDNYFSFRESSLI
jgi:DNA repair protein RadC